jgi:hypothetical protein
MSQFAFLRREWAEVFDGAFRAEAEARRQLQCCLRSGL